MSSLRLPRVSLEESNTGRSLDQPQAKRSRSSRPGQTVSQPYRGQSDRSGAGASSSGNNASDDGPARPFLGWKERKSREWTAQQARLRGDLDILTATAAERRRQLAAQRDATVQRVQALLDCTSPLRCSRCDSSSEPCAFQRSSSSGLTAAFFGLGGACGYLSLPTYDCQTHGDSKVTVNPRHGIGSCFVAEKMSGCTAASGC